MKVFRGSSVVAAATLLGSPFAGARARAGDAPSFSTPISGHTIAVSVGSPWHVSSSYPWKATKSDDASTKLRSFTFSDASATLTDVPSGSWIVSAGACESAGSSCSTKTLNVTVP